MFTVKNSLYKYAFTITLRYPSLCNSSIQLKKIIKNVNYGYFNQTYGTEGTGSRRGAAPPLLTGLHGPGSMAARSFFPADRPREELSLLASFLGVLPAE